MSSWLFYNAVRDAMRRMAEREAARKKAEVEDGDQADPDPPDA